MAGLDDLSKEQLEKMLDLKRQQTKQKMNPDYSQQNKRGYSDALRDFGYGAVKGPWELAKFAGNAATLGYLEDMPGYQKGGQYIDKLIEGIKSPYPSPAGEALQTIGEFAIPGAGAAAAGAKGLRAASKLLPSLTKFGRAKAYRNASESALEEGVEGLPYPKKLIKEIENFYSKHELPGSENIAGLKKGGYEPGMQIKATLSKLSRKYGVDPLVQTSAEDLSANLGKKILKALKEKSYNKTHEATKHAEENYAHSMFMKDLLSGGLKGVAGYELIKKLIQ